jgi:hypothetical protein
LSAIIRTSLFILLLVSCQSQEITPASNKAGTEYFTPEEVIAGMNALVAVIDWPRETIEYQMNIRITPDEAKTLILPLHPLWDEKIEEVASQIPSWSKTKSSTVVAECAKRCDCDFYQAVLDRHPEVLEKAGLALKDFAGLKIQKNKADVLNCLKEMPSIQKLLTYLEKEKKNYEAGSVI